MDNMISGLNKVVCIDIEDKYDGKKVKISNGTNSWEATVSNNEVSFLIPSIPTPARKTYTLTVEGASANTPAFTKEIPMGFGELYTINLAEGYDFVVEKDFNALDNETVSLLYNGDTREKPEEGDDEADPYEGIAFNFGIDADGRYGYYKDGADTVTPFRTGQETLCYYLGEGRSFNIIEACEDIKDTYGIDLDYTELTVNNFVVQPTTSPNAFSEWNGHISEETDTYTAIRVTYDPPLIAYADGTLVVTNSKYKAHIDLSGRSLMWSADTETKESTIKAYLIVMMNDPNNSSDDEEEE